MSAVKRAFCFSDKKSRLSQRTFQQSVRFHKSQTVTVIRYRYRVELPTKEPAWPVVMGTVNKAQMCSCCFIFFNQCPSHPSKCLPVPPSASQCRASTENARNTQSSVDTGPNSCVAWRVVTSVTWIRVMPMCPRCPLYFPPVCSNIDSSA